MATFEVQEIDIVAALAAHRSKHTALRTFSFVFCVFGVCTGLVLVSPQFPHPVLRPFGWGLMGWGLVIAFMGGALPALLAPRGARRVLSNKIYRGVRTWTWTNNALEVKTGYGATTIPWKDFHHFIEAEDVFLFYISPRQYLYFPKRALTELEMQDLRKMISEHVTAQPAVQADDHASGQ
jgi:hypothetical protein